MSSGLFYSWINSCQNSELAVSRTPWVWDQPVINSWPTEENKKIYVDICISWVWFRNTNSVLDGQRQYVLVGVIVFISFNFISGSLHSCSSVSTILLYWLSRALMRKRRRTRIWSRISLIQYLSLSATKRVTGLLVSNLSAHLSET